MSAAPAPPPRATLRVLLRTLAQEGERLELHAALIERQPVILLPESLDANGFSVVTLLPPNVRAPTLKAGHSVHLHGHLQGAPVHLTAALKRLVPGHREWQLDLAMPHAMDYRERREVFRVPVAAQHPAAVAVVFTVAEVLLATVTDLSREGIGLQLRAPGASLPPDERSLRCEIGRDDQRIQARFEPRHQRIQDGHTVCGGRLRTATPLDARRLDDVISELERRWLRQRQDRRPLRR